MLPQPVPIGPRHGVRSLARDGVLRIARLKSSSIGGQHVTNLNALRRSGVPDASIFLVEDEALVRMALASMVEELGHRVVAEAGTIKEAGAIAMTGVFDLAILDINIDGLGIDPVAHVIERRGLPFLFVTGYGAAWLPSLFRRRPVLEKPVSMDRLRDTIDTLLERSAAKT
jgi:DNA-binding NtrC family response regulator